jgi:hypothetical protein
MPLLLAASKQPSAVSRAYRGRYGKRDVDSCVQMGLDMGLFVLVYSLIWANPYMCY